MADEISPKQVWELIEDIRISLLITKDGESLDARPMSAIARSDEGQIYILANRDEESHRQIKEDDRVIVSFQEGATYVVVHGTARPSNDRAKVKDLWSVFDQAWWDGPEDPRIILISIAPLSAEYWESPGKLITYSDMLLSAVIGKKPNTGDHGNVAM
jgi:general stress protein 26